MADGILLQPRQSIHTQSIARLVRDESLTFAVDISFWPEELDRRLNESCYEQHEQDERAEDQNAREETPLDDEAEHEDDEYDEEGADCEAEWHDPT